MDLPLLSAAFIGFALTLYVLLDGFDLGVGILLLLEPDQEARDRMVDAIAPTWDGNETWLIMAGVGLLAAFPTAYGILLPAFYLPLIAMLLALGLRGVSFEFRLQSAHSRGRWDVMFAFGSAVAALMQGLIVGGLIQGVTVDRAASAGGPLDLFSPFSLLCAAAVLTGYVLLGCGWLHFKGGPATRARVRSLSAVTVPVFAGLAALVCLTAALVQRDVAVAWAAHPFVLASLAVSFLGAAAAAALAARAHKPPPEHAPFALAVVMFLCGLGGLGLAIFPNVVPFRLSLWEAAAPRSSHIFLLCGAALVTPVVLAYSAFAYWAFHGRVRDGGLES
jgi:cytochrome d ubiquinol oxidase subunit II